jgi:hypothetical protein
LQGALSGEMPRKVALNYLCFASRQPDTPERMRLGAQVYTLPVCEAASLPSRLPICAGRVHAVRRVSPEGQVRFLNQSLRVGKRYRERYVWLTLETDHQRLRMWYQAPGLSV